MSRTFEERASYYLLLFLDTLKKETGGGQRWNSICEDIVTIYDTKYKELGKEKPYTNQELWSLFFEPPNPTSTDERKRLETAMKDPIFCDVFFTMFRGAFDPPAEWWRNV